MECTVKRRNRSGNINQFKSKLEEYWHDKEYKYDPSGFHDY